MAYAGDALIGILPTWVDTIRVLRRPVRLLRLVGIGGDTAPDDLGPILAAGREEEAAAALADAVMRLSDWDVLALSDMEPGSAFTAAMTAAVRARGWGAPAGAPSASLI